MDSFTIKTEEAKEAWRKEITEWIMKMDPYEYKNSTGKIIIAEWVRFAMCEMQRMRKEIEMLKKDIGDK